MLFAVFLLLFAQFVTFLAAKNSIELICNYGSALGIPLSIPLLLLLSGGILPFLLFQWWNAESFQAEWPWLLLLSGGVSNWLDRITHGCVVDYVQIGIFPVFNAADMLLALGVIGVFWKWMTKSHDPKNERSEQASEHKP